MGTCIKTNIKNIRELKNYTQHYMAFKLGLTQAAYNKIERGKTVLSLKKLEKISIILNISVLNIINFDSTFFLKESASSNTEILLDNSSDTQTILTLYQDKIVILEKLLNVTERELNLYIKKYGRI